MPGCNSNVSTPQSLLSVTILGLVVMCGQSLIHAKASKDLDTLHTRPPPPAFLVLLEVAKRRLNIPAALLYQVI